MIVDARISMGLQHIDACDNAVWLPGVLLSSMLTMYINRSGHSIYSFTRFDKEGLKILNLQSVYI
jgi:hypothetical protein